MRYLNIVESETQVSSSRSTTDGTTEINGEWLNWLIVELLNLAFGRLAGGLVDWEWGMVNG
ncbi:hypothetical protein [Echinicola salinicaeni]|uniref:hypothetical protein n=1 Tax=Echinicola salinicaeni TaxID=2762757 RepID=UPI001646CA03|nr:hypothetical protein [Echinicola salinicaeni]